MPFEDATMNASELVGPYPPEKWPGWIKGMAWAYGMYQHPPTQAAVLRCDFCDHAIRFPTYPEQEDQVNGLMWMMAHTFRHIAAGDVSPAAVEETMHITFE